MTATPPTLDGLVPDHLRPRSARILLDSLCVQADIGFHDYEIGTPQPLAITVEIWLDHVPSETSDDPRDAWNYDHVRAEVERIAGERRYNLQETLVHAVYRSVAALHGVKALRVASTKTDTYANARGVGVEFRSFEGAEPGR